MQFSVREKHRISAGMSDDQKAALVTVATRLQSTPEYPGLSDLRLDDSESDDERGTQKSRRRN